MILMDLLPFIVTYSTFRTTSFGDISAYSAAMTLNFSLLPFLYLWTAGAIYVTFVGGQSAGLIADEVDRGTMLILVSKPISRVQIFLGKFLAVLLFGALMSVISIYTLGWLIVWLLSGNIDHFLAMLPFLNFFVLFSFFLDLIFVSIAMALSSIMKKGKKVGGIIILIVIMTYFGFFMIRMASMDTYTKYYLYYVDIGYHLGNVFVFLNSTFNIFPNSSTWQMFFSLFTGVYQFNIFGGGGSMVDSSQGIDLGGYPINTYVAPVVSFILWVSISILLLLYGLYKLQRKEISN
jgi:ABC-type transport system involved in multi-copper enzyme maturation permease subunit